MSLQRLLFRPLTRFSSRTRFFSTSPAEMPRESMNYDVVIVGGGPAGLAASIRLKQQNPDLSVCLLDKGSEVGSHILSGNVFEPRALDELLPGWREDEAAPTRTEVKQDKLYFLTKSSSMPLPTPPSLHNNGNYILSLGSLCKWLAGRAEALGVEIFPGFAASELLIEDGRVRGVATSDSGIGKDGKPRENFARGMELRASQTLLAEGARGSLSEIAMEKFKLREDCDPQTYGLGIKEVWEIPAAQHREGSVIHTIGWPAPTDTWFGTFLYHASDNRVFLGSVSGLDYPNPHYNPYATFQQWKHHPAIAETLKGGKIIQYGARVLNEGGWQSIPKLSFPGGALIGCSAGFLNVPKIKGSHTAMKSAMLAAEAIAAASKEGKKLEELSLDNYENNVKTSWIAEELKAVRNYHPSHHKLGGLYGFMAYSALSAFLLKGREPWTFRNKLTDAERTKPASECPVLEYPKPDGVLSFDLLSNLQRSGVKHEEDQPSHLRIRPELASAPIEISLKRFNSPESRFCPARVYEIVEDADKKPRLQINQSNCVHCKTCDIKTPANYIKWTVPESGGGPNYEGM